jgi:hypothetical protein
MAIFHRVVVWLDQLAPERGAFAQALDWASSLQLSLHGVVDSTLEPGANHGDFVPPGHGNSDLLGGCARACARRGVAWTASRHEGPMAAAVGQVVLPGDLLVLGASLPAEQKKQVLRKGFHGAEPAILVCPDDGQPWSRVLVLAEDDPPQEWFLAAAVDLCRCLRARPVILTIARSTRAARRRQDAVMDLVAGAGLSCDFDIVVGADVQAAVSHMARWRRCQGIILGRKAAPPWWRWWGCPTPDKIIGLTDSFSLLALPGAGLPAPSLTASGTPPAARETLPLPVFP